jgi:hypothetical protein
MSSTLPPSHITPTIPAVAIVVDSSFTLAREWRRILLEYCTPLFTRLAEGNPSFLPVARHLLRRFRICPYLLSIFLATPSRVRHLRSTRLWWQPCLRQSLLRCRRSQRTKGNE